MPWERQRRETTIAFQAFQTYRDMGVQRSVDRVAAELHKSHALMGRWSKQWNWVDRAAAWDDELDRIKRSEIIKKITEMSERHASMSLIMQEKVLRNLKTLEPEDIKPGDLPRFIETAVKLERLARGLSESNIAIDGHLDVDVTTEEPDPDPVIVEAALEFLRLSRDKGSPHFTRRAVVVDEARTVDPSETPALPESAAS